MRYVTIFLDKEPTEKEVEEFYSDPVRVIDDPKTNECHWEALVLASVYAAAKLTATPFVTHSTCDKKYLKADDKSRHVFGGPGNVHDPEVETVVEP